MPKHELAACRYHAVAVVELVARRGPRGPHLALKKAGGSCVSDAERRC